MHKENYSFNQLTNKMAYHFVSEGSLGQINKGVLFSPIDVDFDLIRGPVFNLAFGDLIESDQEWIFDDSARTGNGDMVKVIATVISIAKDFLTKNHDAILSFQGLMDSKSTNLGKNQRNVLYQRAIDSNWSELSNEFQFWGVNDHQIAPYVPSSQHQQILIMRRKRPIFD